MMSAHSPRSAGVPTAFRYAGQMTSPLANSRGVALLTTLLALVFIVVITLDFGATIRRQLTGANYSMTRIDLQGRARSAVNLAMSVLAADQQVSNYDAITEPWANGGWLQEQTAKLFDDGTIKLAIDDHSGRLQINALVSPLGAFVPEQRERFLRLLSSDEIGLSPDEAEHLLDALKDWLDVDDEISGFGAENSWYQALPNPYACRNGPLTEIDELTLVRGMSPALLYGAGDHPGLGQFLTPYGNNGEVNINTASPLVWRALSPGLNRATVEALLDYRANGGHDLAAPDWYKNVSGELAISQVTVSSNYFGVHVHSSLRNVSLTAQAMLYRPPAIAPAQAPPPAIISWQVE